MTALEYPSYVSLDPYLNLESLKFLDSWLYHLLSARWAKGIDNTFHAGAYPAKGENPVGKARTIFLRGPALQYLDYFDIGRSRLWRYSTEVDQFAPLMDVVRSLPFVSVGRIILIYDLEGSPVPVHRDHTRPDICHEFIWLRTNLRKQFFVADNELKKKKFVESYSAWFDTCNQLHGAEASEGLNWSIRVDGQFSNHFRSQIPFLTESPAATPAHWAAVLNGDNRNETHSN